MNICLCHCFLKEGFPVYWLTLIITLHIVFVIMFINKRNIILTTYKNTESV